VLKIPSNNPTLFFYFCIQYFFSIHASTNNHLDLDRHPNNCETFKQDRSAAHSLMASTGGMKARSTEISETGSHWTDGTLVRLPQIVDRLLMSLSDTLFSRLGTRYEFTLCANGLGRFGALDTAGSDRRGYYD